MYHFGKTSLRRRAHVHPIWIPITNEILIYKDVSVITGYRGKEAQNLAFLDGASTKQYPNSRHNRSILLNRDDISDAVDLAPYVNGKASEAVHECCYLAGLVISIGAKRGATIRWGGNWDGDNEIMTDQKFQDLWHFELISIEGELWKTYSGK